MSSFPTTRSSPLMRHEQLQQLFTYFTPECIFPLLAVIFIASLASALTVLILWRCLVCFGAAGRWLGQDQSFNRATAAHNMQSSAHKSISLNAEEKTVPPSVDVVIDVMVRVFEVFTCCELRDLLRLRSLSTAGNKHDLKKRLATFCFAKKRPWETFVSARVLAVSASRERAATAADGRLVTAARVARK